MIYEIFCHDIELTIITVLMCMITTCHGWKCTCRYLCIPIIIVDNNLYDKSAHIAKAHNLAGAIGSLLSSWLFIYLSGFTIVMMYLNRLSILNVT